MGAIQRVAIVGVGLIGGSFALALRKAGYDGEVIGVSSGKTLEEARRLAIIDRGTNLEEASEQADLIYLAQPISGILRALPQVAAHRKRDSVVTDAGSTKARIVEEGTKHLGPAFIGGHPMAGKERRGVMAADADLFDGKTYVLTSKAENAVGEELEEWIGRIGGKILYVTAEEHDQIVALTSHLPQMASTALAGTVGEGVAAESWGISGSGLRDMTRLALSSYEIWGDIIETNRESILNSIDLYIGRLLRLRALLEGGNASEEFIRAHRFALGFRKPD